LLASGAILLLTVINVLGVILGSRTQNLLTAAKVLGLLALVVVGFGWGRPEATPVVAEPLKSGWLIEVMILVLWTYSGWHEAAYVAAEVKDRRRNLPRALLLGTTAVTVIYLLVNMAYLLGLGFEGARSGTLAVDLVGQLWPAQGEQMMALLVSVSALGAVNGMIFTTARIYAEFGADHRLFAPLGRWSRRWGTPARALIVQGVICLSMTAIVWRWGQGTDSFDRMLYLTSAVFWGFFLLTGIALFVLRHLDGEIARPFRVPLYPWLPLVFCVWCAGMMFGALLDRPRESLAGLLILCAGLPFYFFPQKPRRRQPSEPLLPVPK
jgi:amino acid transporter